MSREKKIESFNELREILCGLLKEIEEKIGTPSEAEDLIDDLLKDIKNQEDFEKNNPEITEVVDVAYKVGRVPQNIGQKLGDKSHILGRSFEKN